MNAKTLVVVGLVVLVLVAVCPVLTIWALNTLFSLAIPVTAGTWASTFWLTLLFAGASRGGK